MLNQSFYLTQLIIRNRKKFSWFSSMRSIPYLKNTPLQRIGISFSLIQNFILTCGRGGSDNNIFINVTQWSKFDSVPRSCSVEFVVTKRSIIVDKMRRRKRRRITRCHKDTAKEIWITKIWCTVRLIKMKIVCSIKLNYHQTIWFSLNLDLFI